MNENINLCELLKGHKGETFYSSVFGKVILKEIGIGRMPITFHYGVSTYWFSKEGKMCDEEDAECVLFPSKEHRDWNKWAEEQKPKVPKTWSELIQKNRPCSNVTLGYRRKEDKSVGDDSWTCNNTPIEKSALALLKIHQLIEVGYGGNITNEEWNDSIIEKFIIYPIKDGFGIDHRFKLRAFRHIAFHTKEQAKEFLSYPENVQLIKDFYMI